MNSDYKFVKYKAKLGQLLSEHPHLKAKITDPYVRSVMFGGMRGGHNQSVKELPSYGNFEREMMTFHTKHENSTIQHEKTVDVDAALKSAAVALNHLNAAIKAGSM